MEGKAPGRPFPSAPRPAAGTHTPTPPQLPRLSPGDSQRAVPVPVGTRAETRDRNAEREANARDGRAFCSRAEPRCALSAPDGDLPALRARRLAGLRRRPGASPLSQPARTGGNGTSPFALCFRAPLPNARFKRINQSRSRSIIQRTRLLFLEALTCSDATHRLP